MESDISASVYKFRYWWNFNWIYGQKCGYMYIYVYGRKPKLWPRMCVVK